MPHIYLIGTVHVDLNGPRRLRRLLAHLQPDALLVEYDESREKMYEALMKLPGERRTKTLCSAISTLFPDANPDTVQRIFEEPDYEYGVCQNYASTHPLDFILADSRGLGTIEQLLAHPRARACLAHYLRMSPRGLSVAVAHIYHRQNDYVVTKDLFDLADIAAADTNAEVLLRSAADRCERIVHVGGLSHLYGAYDTVNLYERIQDLEPRRMKLSEADAL